MDGPVWSLLNPQDGPLTFHGYVDGMVPSSEDCFPAHRVEGVPSTSMLVSRSVIQIRRGYESSLKTGLLEPHSTSHGRYHDLKWTVQFGTDRD